MITIPSSKDGLSQAGSQCGSPLQIDCRVGRSTELPIRLWEITVSTLGRQREPLLLLGASYGMTL